MSEVDDILGGADKPSFQILPGKHAVTVKKFRLVPRPPTGFPFTAIDYEGDDGVLRSFRVDAKYPERYDSVRKQWMAMLVSAIRGKRVQTKELGEKDNLKVVQKIAGGEELDAKLFVIGVEKEGKGKHEGKTFVNAQLSAE